ncbi:hypothetical protein Q0Z83_022580 [Actinoplanes sichuanensis]|uniref:CHAT domain-containing protein n=1 Tax=Actinoplanes sichuanensis TaxID=512349 RepID=A0ABW4AIC7_9ACTN|nr:hypothetical protein [Actinoplanes sichuanensis]BEL04067.1 hypothetical protein Q0Z83_022580 [Actinoplanes sichuanensis]
MIDDADPLRRRLAGLAGPARTQTLCELGQLLADRYWRTGPGNPKGLPDLEESIGHLDEAYGYFQPGDGLRGAVAAQLGSLLTARFSGHGGAERDRESAIALLSEGLDSPRLSPPMIAGAHGMIGQLLLSRCGAGAGISPAFGRGSPAQVDSARQAVEHFQTALAGPQLTPEMTELFTAMLAMAEGTAKTLSGQGGFAMSGMIQAMQTLRRLQKQGLGPGLGAIFTMNQPMSETDPLDRAVPVFDGPIPAPRAPGPAPQGPPHTSRSAASVPPAPDADLARHAFRERLGTGDPYTLLTELLVKAADVDVADDLVALATTVVHTGPPTPADHLFLAAALIQRGRATGGPEALDDHADALTSLRAATAGPGELPDAALPLVLRVGAALGDSIDAPVFARLTAALRAVGADALACPQPDTVLLLHASSGRVAAGTERNLPRRTLIAADRPPASGISIVSTLAGPSQLLTLAGRKRPPVDRNPAFVGTGPEIALFRSCYSRSEPTDPTLLHFADVPAVVATPGLVILPPKAEFPTLADAFIDAGCTGVIGWLRPVPARLATVTYLALHHRMGRERMEPAVAVQSVRRWLRTAQRTPLPGLPDDHLADLAAAEPSLRDIAAALVHRGI